MVKLSGFDVPPPVPVFTIVTFAVPVVLKSLAGIVAVSSLALEQDVAIRFWSTHSVASVAPFHWIDGDIPKLEAYATIGSAPAPTCAAEGAIPIRVGGFDEFPPPPVPPPPPVAFDDPEPPQPVNIETTMANSKRDDQRPVISYPAVSEYVGEL
jgi:hypothetical protein